MQKGFVPIVLVLTVAGLVLAGGFWSFQNIRQINSYEDCGKAGYPVLLSYPGQCNTPDGQHFVQELSEEEKKKLLPLVPETAAISWDVGDVKLGIEGGELQSAVQKLDADSLESKHLISPTTYISITSASIGGDQAVLYGVEKARRSSDIAPTGQYVFLGQKTASGWRLITYGDPDFCSLLQRLPETIMSQGGKDYFIGCRN